MSELFAFTGLKWHEVMIVMIIGVLLFGRRLPDAGRAVGKWINRF